MRSSKKTMQSLEGAAGTAPAAPAIVRERRQFKAHQNLLRDVILSQAGQLEKAITEGVMNSVDAGASNIDVHFDGKSVTLSDDGAGFPSREYIEAFFDVFGTPHEQDEHGASTDATYGRFRMGRGQMFSFGANTWESGRFRMEVDVKKEGLDYHLCEVDGPGMSGCRIHIELYSPVDVGGYMGQKILKELGRYCRFMPQNVRLNGERISIDPTAHKWTEEDGDAYYDLRPKGAKKDFDHDGVDAYNQGVFVENFGSHRMGCSGYVVAKEQLKLNMARNNVMPDCPRWKRIQSRMQALTTHNLVLKKQLDESERSALISKLRAGEVAYRLARACELFVDVRGRGWSADSLARLTNRGTKWALNPAQQLRIAFAAQGDRIGDKVIQACKGVVLDDSTPAMWGVTADEFVGGVLDKFCVIKCKKAQVVPLNTLMDENLRGDYSLVDAKLLTERERMILRVLASGSYFVVCQFRRMGVRREERVLRIGTSKVASGWTDGTSYIAISRSFLPPATTALTQRYWTDMSHLLVHEYCHDSPDDATHVHGVEFYQLYHDVSCHVGDFAQRACNAYMQALLNAGRKLPNTVRSQLDRDVSIRGHEAALWAGVDQPMVAAPQEFWDEKRAELAASVAEWDRQKAEGK